MMIAFSMSTLWAPYRFPLGDMKTLSERGPSVLSKESASPLSTASNLENSLVAHIYPLQKTPSQDFGQVHTRASYSMLLRQVKTRASVSTTIPWRAASFSDQAPTSPMVSLSHHPPQATPIRRTHFEPEGKLLSPQEHSNPPNSSWSPASAPAKPSSGTKSPP